MPESVPENQTCPQLTPERVTEYQNCPQLKPERVVHMKKTS